ncbi:fructose-bisphosphate aldolase [Pseudomonas rossensis]|uniref:fructose-bisphosphate aldolase n=1 Tax=Pseudomonas rossensis TaxID=2305471 RepID=UPI003260721B
MNNQQPPRRFTPMSQFATDYPVLLIDSDAPLRELHNCVSERLNAVTNIARIMVQDVSDVFRVIEQRGFETPKSQ